MSEIFLNRYRMASCRLPGWDYGRNGAYFITICTHGRQPFFGYIHYDEMFLSDVGKLAFQVWSSIPDQFSFVHLDEYVIMPDHMHGILVIDHSADDIGPEGMDAGGMDTDTGGMDKDTGGMDTDTGGMDTDTGGMDTDTGGNVETRLIASLHYHPHQYHPHQYPQDASPHPAQRGRRPGGFAGNKNPMLHQNISRVIRWYKGRCCFEIRKILPGFAWQTRFYDRVIRSSKEMEHIRKYIRENPSHF